MSYYEEALRKYPMMNFITKFQSLSLDDYRVLFWANALLPVTALRLRFRGFRRAHAWAKEGPVHRTLRSLDTVNRPIHMGKMVNFVATHGLYRANCLCRSLVLLKLMLREGYDAELKVGIAVERKDQSQSILAAHAWVEYQGVVINDQANVAKKHAVFDLTESLGAVKFNE